ncbi:LysM peptidoglycan-binding domain-containing protein [Tenacibaculum jejuense]|uniref:LysM domain-containing protein n=1 Tax=Tenacibaculum jejuense TaxID=584609 RepID=A0A238UBS1_9FLAO|nr:LysM peptidoglycan-binding domain-containing protein [Tenacibaculum jejuense]SNR16542.1 protein of unknown function [Tenacibaculum jejuense]
MKNQVTVRNNQSFFDIAIQTTGIASNAILIAQANNLSPTDKLVVGTSLIIPDEATTDPTIKNYYDRQSLLPASGLTKNEEDITQGLQGIGYWTIGSSFKVEGQSNIVLDDVDIIVSDKSFLLKNS